jgi:hypothetical protein
LDSILVDFYAHLNFPEAVAKLARVRGKSAVRKTAAI